MSKKKRVYTIQAEIKVCTTTEVHADDLEDALKKSKTLNVHDFIDINGDHIESELNISGIY